MKKSKPKQRTNWKQRALHCEEVIGVQNELAKAADAKVKLYADVLSETQRARDEYKARAETAEKHIGGLRAEIYCLPPPAKMLADRKCAPTHWQRFKSWLSSWRVEVR